MMQRTPLSSLKRQMGFTLVELSIVLVVVALIVGGVLFGRDLIRTAEIQGIISEVQQHKTAIFNFENQYLGLPGDLYNATDFWTTSNGNADGVIATATEGFLAWEHLSSSGLVAGSYDGTPTVCTIGTNAPASTFVPAGYYIGNTSDALDTGITGNYLGFGAQRATTTCDNAVIRPEDAYYIDSKTDDGVASTGVVLTNYGLDKVNTDCITGTSGTHDYDLTDPESNCRIFFMLE